MPIKRRELLTLVAGSTFFLTAGSARGTPRTLPAMAPPVSFAQGVASADPGPGSVMLWTRAEPSGNETETTVILQVSTGPAFADLVLEEVLHTGRDSDFTLRAYVDGLQPDSHYFYRFLGAAGSRSRLGRTRTAPAADQPARARLVLASCQNYEQGYYGAWARMLADDDAAPADQQIDFVLHVGDFIYERNWDPQPDRAALSRRVPAFPDGAQGEGNRYAVSLDDYRHLYRVYLADPHLQAARARWPFVCIWDDHEFSNDNFQSYNTYGDTPVLEAQRKLDANRAWFEYIPAVLDQAREPDTDHRHGFRAVPLDGDPAQDNAGARDSLCVYRRLGWGSTLDLVLTDNRSYRSAPCLDETMASSLGLPMNTVRLVEIADGGRDYDDGRPPAVLPYGDGDTPNPAAHRPAGSCLGERQRAWLLATLRASRAVWKLWGNSLPLMPMRIDMSSIPFQDYEDSIFNLDSWAGFPAEQARIMRHLRDHEVTGVVSLSGDHHMHGAGTVSWSAGDPDAVPVAVDFTVAALSSTPLFEEISHAARASTPDFVQLVFEETDGEPLPVWNMTMLDGVLASIAYSRTGARGLARWLGPNRANPGLAYVDTQTNGYAVVEVTPAELTVQMHSIADVRTPFEQPPAIARSAHFRVAAWSAGQQPVLEGPRFTGAPPFPFGPESLYSQGIPDSE
jgi:alkaline phosphatase D